MIQININLRDGSGFRCEIDEEPFLRDAYQMVAIHALLNSASSVIDRTSIVDAASAIASDVLKRRKVWNQDAEQAKS